MADWTVDQVIDWLKANGLERYRKTFRDEDIDGIALIGLKDDEISKLICIKDKDGTLRNSTRRTLRKFQVILEKYRTYVKQNKKIQRRNSSLAIKENSEDKDGHKNELLFPSFSSGLDTKEMYSKTFTIKPNTVNFKFFKSEILCSYLINYYLQKYNVTCHVPIIDQEYATKPVHIKLFGGENHVDSAYNNLEILMQSIQTKTFNDDHSDKKVIRWSKSIWSDSALVVLQKAFINKKKLTCWEKTNVLSGYFIVHYRNSEHELGISEEFLNRTINNELSYVKNILIPNFDTIQINFRTELNCFLNNKKEQYEQCQTMAIIYCQYPNQKLMKISLFGLRNQVDIAKAQIKALIDKHRMRKLYMNLSSKEREYLLDNCIVQLKAIENDYKNDGVKIPFRENLLIAPQYLVTKIKQLIQSMLYQTVTLTCQYIENDLKINLPSKTYDYELIKIDTSTKNESIELPKGQIQPITNRWAEQSKQFHSSLLIQKNMSIFTNKIEIHTSYDLPVDISVISSVNDAIKENLDPNRGNGYFESDTEKKILFIKWSPNKSTQDSEKSIKNFVSTSIKQLETICKDSNKTISFLTTEWENYRNQKELVEIILTEIKYQFQAEKFRNKSWKILFICNEQQKGLHDCFSQVCQAESDLYEEISYPITTTTIVFKLLENSNIHKCKNEIEKLIEKTISTSEIADPFNSKIWNQSMIYAFYKYCFEKKVLLQLSQERKFIKLIGSLSTVKRAKEKYELMSKIQSQRNLDENFIIKSNRQFLTLPPAEVLKNRYDSYDIILSCSSNDRLWINEFACNLIKDGYLISIHYSDNLLVSIESEINKTDLFLICFSTNYKNDLNCMKTLLSIKSSEKAYIPVLLLNSSSDNQDEWNEFMHLKEIYYTAFEDEIKFTFDDDFDLSYDRLIIELLSKNVSIEQVCSISESNIKNEETIESSLTDEQIEEKQRVYREKIQEILERKKISDAELKDLVESANTVLEDFTENEQLNSDSYYLNAFLSNIRDWVEKSLKSPIVRDNLPPFTVTGDFNDAIFPIASTEKEPWWIHGDVETALDNSGELSQRELDGLWFNNDESYDYYRRLIDKDREYRKKMPKSNEIDDNERRMQFITSIKKGNAAWDLTENTQIWKEYERRKSSKLKKKEKVPKSRNHYRYNRLSILWDSLMDRSVALIEKLEKGEIKKDSDQLQGRIGREYKTEEEKRKREELDDPKNKRWANKRVFSWRRQFIQMKIKNTIEWQKFYEENKNKMSLK